MISYLSGKIIIKKEKFIIIDVNGIGYKVFLSSEKINLVEKGKKTDFFCYSKIRNDGSDLYGFLTIEELEFFEFLMGVSGIGPKAGLEISSLGSLEKLKKAIENDDEKILEKLFLAGKKKAQAIIFEISRKIKTNEIVKKEDEEAIQALLKLGFKRKEIKETLAKIESSNLKSEDKIEKALKLLGKKQ